MTIKIHSNFSALLLSAVRVILIISICVVSLVIQKFIVKKEKLPFRIRRPVDGNDASVASHTASSENGKTV